MKKNGRKRKGWVDCNGSKRIFCRQELGKKIWNNSYENTKNINGYITEKIFDSFHAGCIPIYLGADNITNYIPQNCFIDKRMFKSYNELYVFLKTMTKHEYLTYLQNIKEFLNSDKAKLFTGENLIGTFKEALNLKEQNL